MKSIEIYVDGQYDYKFKIETWIYYMSYKNAVIKNVGQETEDGSQVRSALLALYKSLEHINEPCDITIYSKMQLGFKTPKSSRNKELLYKILLAVNKAGHIIRFNIDREFSKPLMWEQLYGNSNNNVGKGIEQQTAEQEKTEISSQLTAEPDIKDRKSPNDVFDKQKEQEMLKKEWEELLNDKPGGAWTPFSGGY